MSELDRFLSKHDRLTRRFFLNAGVASASLIAGWPQTSRANEVAPELAEAIGKLESFLTPLDKFRDVSRGKPLPHSLPPEKKTEVGLTRETWKLEVVSDTEKNSTRLRKPMKKRMARRSISTA